MKLVGGPQEPGNGPGNEKHFLVCVVFRAQACFRGVNVVLLCKGKNIQGGWDWPPSSISPSFSQGVRGSPLENSAPAAFAAAAAEDGPLLAAQHGGADTADVNVCPAGSLDGLHLVHHWQDGDGGQLLQLGYRWVQNHPGKTRSLTHVWIKTWPPQWAGGCREHRSFHGSGSVVWLRFTCFQKTAEKEFTRVLKLNDQHTEFPWLWWEPLQRGHVNIPAWWFGNRGGGGGAAAVMQGSNRLGKKGYSYLDTPTFLQLMCK